MDIRSPIDKIMFSYSIGNTLLFQYLVDSVSALIETKRWLILCRWKISDRNINSIDAKPMKIKKIVSCLSCTIFKKKLTNIGCD